MIIKNIRSYSKKICHTLFSCINKSGGLLSPVRIRKKLRASLTLEAAAALPLFMMICAALMSFLVLCSVQMDIQIHLEETARKMGKAAFLLEHSITSDHSPTGESIGSDEVSVMSAGLNSASIKLMLLSSKGFGASVGRSRIAGGISGIHTYGSSFDEKDALLDIVVNYDYSVPWVPQSWGLLRLAQRMRSHVWTGRPLVSMNGAVGGNGGKKSDASDTVYVTPSGTVYHLSPSCHYLDLSIHAASFDSIPSARNANGSKYTKCPVCAGSGHNDTVYITDYGTDWHTSLECSGLKRTVMEKDITEVEGMRVCTKCKNTQHDHEHD